MHSTERNIRIALSIALLAGIFWTAGQLNTIAHELTRIRATMEQSVYGAVQKDPNY